ncbi:MAG: shikimate kinase [Acidobacteriota bacterium]|nr:shikimate kinase [Acidobacteriota bacterium]
MKVLLTGFMGAGKTTVGRAVAERLGLEFVDLDDMIEQADGRTVREIFESAGEEEFRRLERAALAQVLDETDAVIATGGGTLANEEALRSVAHQTVSVWLNPALDVIERRLDEAGGEQRPLLDDATRVRSLFRRRLPFYRLAALRIDIGGDESVAEVADRLVRMLRESRCAF